MLQFGMQRGVQIARTQPASGAWPADSQSGFGCQIRSQVHRFHQGLGAQGSAAGRYDPRQADRIG